MAFPVGKSGHTCPQEPQLLRSACVLTQPDAHVDMPGRHRADTEAVLEAVGVSEAAAANTTSITGEKMRRFASSAL